MAADISSPVSPATDGGQITVASRTHRVRSWVLLAFAAYNVWVWATRAINMIGDRQEWSVGFVVVHLVLFAGGFGGAAVLGTIGWRMRRESRGAAVGAPDS